MSAFSLQFFIDFPATPTPRIPPPPPWVPPNSIAGPPGHTLLPAGGTLSLSKMLYRGIEDVSVFYLDPYIFLFPLLELLRFLFLMSASKTTSWSIVFLSLSLFPGPYLSFWAVSLSTIKLTPIVCLL